MRFDASLGSKPILINAWNKKMNSIPSALCVHQCKRVQETKEREREREGEFIFSPFISQEISIFSSSGFRSSIGLSSLRVAFNGIRARDCSATFARNCRSVPKLATPITWTRSAALVMARVDCCSSAQIFRCFCFFSGARSSAVSSTLTALSLNTSLHWWCTQNCTVYLLVCNQLGWIYSCRKLVRSNK